MTIPSLPSSWSALSWPQLCGVWTAKMRYGGNPDVAIAAAFLSLCQFTVEGQTMTDPGTGETVYRLKDKEGRLWTATPRQLAYFAKRSLPWFPFPYGDQGDKEEKDDQGKVTKEKREGHAGYVNPDVGNWRDAMALPEETVVFCGSRMMAGSEWEKMGDDERQQIVHTSLFTLHFSLPQAACSNITWHQYRSLQTIVSQLFQDGISEGQVIDLQAQFMAYITVPEEVSSSKVQALSDYAPHGLGTINLKSGTKTDPFAPLHTFTYKADRAEAAVPFWREQLRNGSPLFNICFQVYQTAMQNFYAQVYYDLFNGTSRQDPLQTALTGEVGTINAVMKYQGYTDPQQIYDANLPIILGVLNNMTKESKEIEKMNQQIKRRKK